MAFSSNIYTQHTDPERKTREDDLEAQTPRTRQINGYNSLDVDDEVETPPHPISRLASSACLWFRTSATNTYRAATQFWRNEGGLANLALPLLGLMAYALYCSNNSVQNSQFNSNYKNRCDSLNDCKSDEAKAQANGQAFAITNGSLYTVTNTTNSLAWFAIWIGVAAFVLNLNRKIHSIQAQQRQLHDNENDGLNIKFNGLTSEIKILAQQGKDEIRALLESGKTDAQPSSKSPTIEKQHKSLRETLLAVLHATGSIGPDKRLNQDLLDNLQLPAEKKGQFIHEIAIAMKEHDNDDIQNAHNGFTRK